MITASVVGVIHGDIEFSDQRGAVATRISFVISSSTLYRRPSHNFSGAGQCVGKIGYACALAIIDDAQCVASGELALVDGRLALRVDSLEIIRPLQSPQSVTVTLSNGNNH